MENSNSCFSNSLQCGLKVERSNIVELAKATMIASTAQHYIEHKYPQVMVHINFNNLKKY